MEEHCRNQPSNRLHHLPIQAWEREQEIQGLRILLLYRIKSDSENLSRKNPFPLMLNNLASQVPVQAPL
jgi:hypothetical protein